MKQRIFAVLLAAAVLGLGAVPTAAADIAVPAAGQVDVSAPAAVGQAEYLVIKQRDENGDYAYYQKFTTPAEVRRVKALLPDYDGGAMVEKQLSGTPIMVRYVNGTDAWAYEIFPNDLIVWWYDMKCATVKGAYATVSALLQSAPAPTEEPRLELREYGAGDFFRHYSFPTTPAATWAFVNCVENMRAVETPKGPFPGGGFTVSMELIRGLSSDSYYVMPYGYAQHTGTGQYYRLQPGALDFMWEQMGVKAADTSPSVILTWWPADVELPASRSFYPQAAAPQGTASTTEQISALLKQRKNAPESSSSPGTTPLIATAWAQGKITERYFLYENGLVRDTLARQWYTLPEDVFTELCALVP